ALSPVEGLAKRWRGRLPFAQMLQRASGQDFRLLRVSALALGTEQEREYVSLGHDALAPVAAAWDRELSQGARFQKLAVRMGLLVLCLATVMVALLLTLNLKDIGDELTERMREGNHTVARLIADGFGWQVRRSWRDLEEKQRDREFRKHLRNPDD